MDAERKGIKTMAEVKKVATRESYGATLAELAAEYPNLVVLDADLAGATKTASFKKVCPERFIDCGIAEGNMMGVAGRSGSSRHDPVCKLLCDVCSRKSV